MISFMTEQGSVKRFFVRLVNKWMDDRLGYVANGLAFTTAFAVVPMLAIWVGLFGGFKEFMSAKTEYLLQTFLPEGLVNPIQVELKIGELVKNAGALSAIGVVFLVFAGIWLFYSIEDSFNRIWHVRRRRGFWLRITTFWMVLTLAPLLVAFNLYLTAIINQTPSLAYFVSLTFRFIPPLFSWLACWLAFTIIPNTKVDSKLAALGALFSAAAWEAEKWLFNSYMGYSQNYYNQLYTSVVAIPLVLIWIQLSWMTVLAGLVFTFLWQNPSGAKGRLTGLQIPYPAFHALGMVFVVNDNFQQGGGATLLRTLCERLGLHIEYTYELAAWLMEQGFLISAGSPHQEAFVPGRPPEKVNVAGLVMACEPDFWEADPAADPALIEEVGGFLAAQHQRLKGEWQPDTLQKLLETVATQRQTLTGNVAPLRPAEPATEKAG